MDINVEKERNSETEFMLRVTVSSEEVAGRVETAISELAKKAQFPGFRPGKMPRKLIVEKYGSVVTSEALQEVLQEAYRAALQQADLKPISPGEMSDVKYDHNSPLTFSVKVEVMPEIGLPDLTDISVELLKPEAAEEDVAVALDNIRESASTLVPTEEGAETDSVIVVDLQELDSSGVPVVGRVQRDMELDLRRVNLGEDFAQKVIGIAEGKSFIAELPLHDNAEGKGKTRLEVSVKSVKHREWPVLNEEFVKSVNPNLNTLEELRADLKKYIEARASLSARDRMYKELVELILRRADFPLPPSMIEDYLERVAEGAKRDDGKPITDRELAEFKEQYRANAIRNLRWYTLRARFVEEHKLDITKLELAAEIDRLAHFQGETPAEYQRRLSEEQIHHIREDIRERKVFQFLEAQVTVVPRSVTLAEFEGRKQSQLITS